MPVPEFELWLDTEDLSPGEFDPENDHCDAVAKLATGEVYSLKIWTFKYLQTCVAEDKESGEHLGGRYLPAPDVFVESLDPKLVREAIADMLARDEVDFETLLDEDEDYDEDDEEDEDGDE